MRIRPLFVSLIVVAGCRGPSPLVGVWKEVGGQDNRWVFNSDGTWTEEYFGRDGSLRAHIEGTYDYDGQTARIKRHKVKSVSRSGEWKEQPLNLSENAAIDVQGEKMTFSEMGMSWTYKRESP